VRALALIIVFIVLAGVFTYPRINHLADGVSDPGDPLQTAWILAWESRALTRGFSGFFDANILYPHRRVLAFSEHMLGLLPLAAPLNWLGHNPILTYNLLFLLTFAGSGLAAYALAQELTNDSRAALIAGFGFGFASYRTAHQGHLEILALFWMPLALLFLHRFLRQRRVVDAALFTLFFNLQALVSYYYAFMLTFAVAALLLVRIAFERAWPNRWVVTGLALAGAVTALIQVPIATIYFRVNQEMGLVRTLDEVKGLSAHPWDYVAASPYAHLYAGLTANWRDPAWSEHSLFPGLVLPALALVGLTRLRHTSVATVAKGERWTKWGYLAVLLLTIIMMLGPELSIPRLELRLPLPYSWLYRAIPGLQGLRTPARFWGVGLLALSVLAGYGVTRLVPGSKWAGLAATLGLLILLGVEVWSVPAPVAAILPVGQAAPPAYSWVRDDAASQVVLELPLPLELRNFDTIAMEARRMYFSTIHWKQLVNGYVAFDLPDRDRLAQELQAFPDATTIERLRTLGVNTILISG